MRNNVAIVAIFTKTLRPDVAGRQMAAPKFIARERSEFAAVLRGRVRSYFADNNLSQKDDARAATKGALMLGLYLLPFCALLFWQPTQVAEWLLLAALQGIGTAGVGMCIMHDALHGSLSAKSRINEFWGFSMYLLGGSVFAWKMQHNRAHHTYTNILGHDEDIRERSYLRLSPNAPWQPVHRYQHLYALALYPLMTFSMLFKDFASLRAYERAGLLAEAKTTYGRQLRDILFGKALYLAVVIGLPVAFGVLSIWQSLAYFTVMHFFAGFILSVIFQLAHAVEEAEHPLPNTAGNIDNEWMIHQLETTVNFCPGSPLLNWYSGGLNYQVEHHLFPNICHIHYPALAKIVKATADEFGIAYNQVHSFGEIFNSHLALLKKLGEKPAVVPTPVERELELA